MKMMLDSNVVIDVVSADLNSSVWSSRILRDALERGDRLLINDVVYAEVSPGFVNVASLDRTLDALSIELAMISRQALFNAGRAFAAYRRRSASRSTILPDFIIGAHAADLKLPLVTRDTKRYGTYFPDLTLITP